MPKIYLLPSCKTCQRILATLQQVGEWEVHDIKSDPITKTQLEAFAKTAGSYEALFSRRAVLYRERGLKDQTLAEDDYKRLILEHYTFLKRPIMEVGNQLFVGNSKKAVEGAVRAV